MNDQPEANPFKPGTLAHQLWVATQAMKRIEPRPKRQPSSEPRKKILAVRATGKGDSNPQKASRRRAILDWIRAQPDQHCTIEVLEAQFQQPVRGHVQKLIEKKHLEAA